MTDHLPELIQIHPPSSLFQTVGAGLLTFFCCPTNTVKALCLAEGWRNGDQCCPMGHVAWEWFTLTFHIFMPLAHIMFMFSGRKYVSASVHACDPFDKTAHIYSIPRFSRSRGQSQGQSKAKYFSVAGGKHPHDACVSNYHAVWYTITVICLKIR